MKLSTLFNLIETDEIEKCDEIKKHSTHVLVKYQM